LERIENGLPVNVLLGITSVLKMQPEPPPPSWGILTLIKVEKGWPDQTDTPDAMKYLNDMLDLTPDILLKNTAPTLGPLARTVIPFHVQWKVMSQGLDQGAGARPFLAAARAARLYHWTITNMKTHDKLYAECVKFLALVHEDYREREVNLCHFGFRRI
jgi:hypothetical protein